MESTVTFMRIFGGALGVILILGLADKTLRCREWRLWVWAAVFSTAFIAWSFIGPTPTEAICWMMLAIVSLGLVFALSAEPASSSRGGRPVLRHGPDPLLNLFLCRSHRARVAIRVSYKGLFTETTQERLVYPLNEPVYGLKDLLPPVFVFHDLDNGRQDR